MSDDQASINTAIYRLPAIARNLLSNVQRCTEKPYVDTNRPVWDVRTAIVVGAGPSLDKNAHLLTDAMDRGCVVLAVNSALPVLHRHGIKPHVAVGIESIPNDRHYVHGNWGSLLCQWSSAPDLWDRADAWIADAQPTWMRLARTLGVPALPCGASASGTAISLAVRLGAGRIVLVGHDLSYDLERGQSYAQGAVWQDWRPELDDKGLRFDGAPERDEMRKEQGAVGVPRRQKPHRLPAWGGQGEVVTDVTFRHQLNWLEWLGSRDGTPELVDCTEGGARKQGWPEERLQDVLSRVEPTDEPIPPVPTSTVSLERLDAAMDYVRHEAAMAQEMGAKLAAGESHWDAFADGLPLARAFAIPDIIGMNQRPELNDAVKLRANWEVWREAGKLMQRYATGE